MVRTPAQAIAWANNVDRFDTAMCLKFVRSCFDIAAVYRSAAIAWAAAQHRHPGDRNPPPGVPMWWTGGASGHGHVAISLGGGRFRSTDVPRSGRVGNSSLDTFTWPHRYVGWSEDINGVRVFQALPDTGGDEEMSSAEYRALDEKLNAIIAAVGNVGTLSANSRDVIATNGALRTAQMKVRRGGEDVMWIQDSADTGTRVRRIETAVRAIAEELGGQASARVAAAVAKVPAVIVDELPELPVGSEQDSEAAG
ncbi:MAG TPA: hypothetical protein VIQ30_22710 [Pseudonocardia sp.]